MMADPFDHGHVVADEQKAQAQIGLQFHHQVQHLGLDADIQRADGLVRDDQLGVQRQRAGDGDALALATRQLVREAAHEAARQFDPVEEHRATRSDSSLPDTVAKFRIGSATWSDSCICGLSDAKGS
jgi:hypothetical protein